MARPGDASIAGDGGGSSDEISARTARTAAGTSLGRKLPRQSLAAEETMEQLLLAMLLLLLLGSQLPLAACETDAGEVQVLHDFLEALDNPQRLQWAGNDPCGESWKRIVCRGSSITKIDVSFLNLRGTVSKNVNKLANLEYLSLQGNSLAGSLPSLSGLKNLQVVYLGSNLFSSIPPDFFTGLDSLTALYLDHNQLNGTRGWALPPDVAKSSLLSNLSLTNTSLSGSIPDFLGSLPQLKVLNLAYNRLSGGIPASFASSNIVQLQANNMQGPVLTGPIDAVGSMSSLEQLWLHVNGITGAIPPGLSNAVTLHELKLNDNQLTGPIPQNFTSLPLASFTVENNHLNGPIPALTPAAQFLFTGNSFCQPTPGVSCAPEVNVLLDFIGAFGYPASVVSSWKGNNPCNWPGIVCNAAGRVSVINLPGNQFVGRVSPSIAKLTALTILKLNDNNISGPIPAVLTSIKSLEVVNLENNNLSGDLPQFPEHVRTNFDGNPLLRSSASAPLSSIPKAGGSPSKSSPAGSVNPSIPSSPGSPYPESGGSPAANATGDVAARRKRRSVPIAAVAGPVVAGLSLLVLGSIVFVLMCKKSKKRFVRVQSPNNSTILVHPRDSGSDPESLKITVPGDTRSVADTASINTNSSDVHLVEAGNLVISIQVLRSATRNFSEETVLGKGGFGVVYRGQLHDGTNIAVKRMESSSVVSSKGLNEFHAEIAVLSKVRHRHLVALLGYCIDGHEKLLVYEYLPQGALSHHLFEYRKMGLKPLDWKRRLVVALDVSRGMEYLHNLAHRSFIHRDLKPSNILLDDDMRAKVSDFGLVKLAPEGKYSIETKLAGTFGYLAPEYAVTGRVTTKADVFSFGVVLMELITGRRALDESQAEENVHLVTWFRRLSNSNKLNSKEALLKAIDSTLCMTDICSDTFQSICTVAELARHCTAREPYQRPDMGHAVSVLAPLVDQWKPTDQDGEESAGIDLSLTLPQALKKWQAFEDCTTAASKRMMMMEYDSQASLPTRPAGFAEALTTADGR